MNVKIAPLAVAIAAALATPLVLASEPGNNDHGQHNNHSPYSESTRVVVNNEVSAKTSRSDSSSRHVDVSGHLHVFGIGLIDSSSSSLIDDKQINTSNDVANHQHHNNANVGDSSGQGASGNIGINSAAGDNNMQDNAAALSASDAHFVFGSNNATAITYQENANNSTLNDGNVNNAGMSGSALSGATGNIGVNLTAGDSNLQKNNFSGSVATARIANANVTTIQRSKNNQTVNQGRIDRLEDTTQVTLHGGMVGTYAGKSWGSYSGTSSGTTSGTSDQMGNVYLDVWNMNSEGSTPTHPTDTGPIGHVDVDNQAQGAKDLNHDGGAFAFNNSGSYSGTQSGGYAGHEVGGQALLGSFSGSVATVRYVVTPSENNANLSGSALSGALGNIGVNIASGTGNMQNNSLAVAGTQPGASVPMSSPAQ